MNSLLLIFLSPLFRGDVGTFPNTPDNDWRGGDPY
jgi:hypothetical protein